MASWHRLHLVDLSYALGLMARRTPAWTEPYVAVLDQLVERHTSWWSAADWSTRFGQDPSRADDSDADRLHVPPELWGDDGVPGWTADGVEPYGVQMDPVAADGMLFDTGFLLVLLGIRSMVAHASGDDRWNEPFELIRDGEHSSIWTHTEMAEHLTRQWLAAPVGCRRENTKVWPFCLAGAGLGLRLHDNRHGTDLHEQAFTPWWRYARRAHLDLDGESPPTETTLDHDPVLGIDRRVPVGSAITTSFYAAPQEPSDARRLFDATVAAAGFDAPIERELRASRGAASALVLAREWGVGPVEEALAAAIETWYEPTWDVERGEFTWGLGLDEGHPRGQLDAFLAAAEAGGPGRWEALSAGPIERCPQIVDVDVPAVALTRAWWEGETLRLTLAPLVEDPARRTQFRIVGVEPRLWWVNGIDGVSLDVRSNQVIVRCPMVAGDLEFTPSSY